MKKRTQTIVLTIIILCPLQLCFNLFQIFNPHHTPYVSYLAPIYFLCTSLTLTEMLAYILKLQFYVWFHSQFKNLDFNFTFQWPKNFLQMVCTQHLIILKCIYPISAMLYNKIRRDSVLPSQIQPFLLIADILECDLTLLAGTVVLPQQIYMCKPSVYALQSVSMLLISSPSYTTHLPSNVC